MELFHRTGIGVAREVPPDERRAYRWIVFSIAFAVFMVRLDSYIVTISLPTIARFFQVGTNEVSWVVLSYLLVMTGSMLIFGKLGDRIGFKKIFLYGFVCFTFSSLLCGLSPNIYALDVGKGSPGNRGGHDDYRRVRLHLPLSSRGDIRLGLRHLLARQFPRDHGRRPAGRNHYRLLFLAVDLPDQHPGRDRGCPAGPQSAP